MPIHSDPTKMEEGELIYALDIGTRSVIGMLGALEQGRIRILALEKQPHARRAPPISAAFQTFTSVFAALKVIISRKLSESENVDDVSVMMGTPANKALLDTTGFWHDDFNNATPNDICVAIRSEAADAGIAQAIMQQLEEALKQLASGNF